MSDAGCGSAHPGRQYSTRMKQIILGRSEPATIRDLTIIFWAIGAALIWFDVFGPEPVIRWIVVGLLAIMPCVM